MNAEVDVNDLLDATLDDLEDLPEFANFNPGGHLALATFTEKEVNDNKCIELALKLKETLELADSQDTAQEPGTEASVLFMLNNEFGRGNLKKCAMPFGQALGFGTIREIVDGVKDVECVVVTGLRTDKNDKDKKYMNIKEITVVG